MILSDFLIDGQVYIYPISKLIYWFIKTFNWFLYLQAKEEQGNIRMSKESACFNPLHLHMVQLTMAQHMYSSLWKSPAITVQCVLAHYSIVWLSPLQFPMAQPITVQYGRAFYRSVSFSPLQFQKLQPITAQYSLAHYTSLRYSLSQSSMVEFITLQNGSAHYSTVN